MIFVVRATAGQERIVSELLYREAAAKKEEIEKDGGTVYSVLYTTGLKGYILVEADSPGTVEILAMGVPKTRGLLLKKKGELETASVISIEELENMLMPRPVIADVNRGDLVELISGPFKSEKARVARIDKDKNEITVELIEAAVPIPVIVRGDDVKVLKRKSGEGAEAKEEVDG